MKISFTVNFSWNYFLSVGFPNIEKTFGKKEKWPLSEYTEKQFLIYCVAERNFRTKSTYCPKKCSLAYRQRERKKDKHRCQTNRSFRMTLSYTSVESRTKTKRNTNIVDDDDDETIALYACHRCGSRDLFFFGGGARF